MYNRNAIEIVTKGRIWPRAVNYSNFFKGRRGKKSKTFYSKQKTFKQESTLGKDMDTKWISLGENSEDEGKLKEQEAGRENMGQGLGGLHEDRDIHLVNTQAPPTTPGTNEALYRYLVA